MSAPGQGDGGGSAGEQGFGGDEAAFGAGLDALEGQYLTEAEDGLEGYEPGPYYEVGPDDEEPWIAEGYYDEEPADAGEPVFDAADPAMANALAHGWSQLDENGRQALAADHPELAAAAAEASYHAECAALEGEFPELADAASAQALVNAAQELAAAMGAPEAGGNPAFWRTVYVNDVAGIRSRGQHAQVDPPRRSSHEVLPFGPAFAPDETGLATFGSPPVATGPQVMSPAEAAQAFPMPGERGPGNMGQYVLPFG